MFAETFFISFFLFFFGIISNLNARNSDFRIHHGTEVSVKNYSFMLRVLHTDNDNVVSCGGTLVTKKCVLTAAHCIGNVPVERFTIARMSNHNEIEMRRKAKKVFVMPIYNKIPHDGDVAILKMYKKIEAYEAKPVKLRYKSDVPNHIYTLGWGKIAPSEKPKEALRIVKSRLIDLKTCQDSLSMVTRNMLCAEPSIKRPAQGDSGGPAITEAGYQVGIVSFLLVPKNRKSRKNDEEKPALFFYTRIGSPAVATFLMKKIAKYCH